MLVLIALLHKTCILSKHIGVLASFSFFPYAGFCLHVIKISVLLLELLSTKEIVPVKTVDGEAYGSNTRISSPPLYWQH